MSHFTEGVLQAYLDDEVAADARVQVSAHVSDCANCAARLQELRELNASFASAMGSLDARTITTVSLADLRKRAAKESWRDRWAGSRRYLTRAAVLILGVTVAAVPGSPVRAWLAETWNDLTQDEPVAAPPVQEPPLTPEPTPPPTGFTVHPRAGTIQVMLESLAPGTVVRVVLTDSNRAFVEASGGSTTAKFRTSTGQAVITGGDQGEIRISVPRAVNGTVELNGRPLVVKQGEELRFVGTGESQRVADGVGFTVPK